MEKIWRLEKSRFKQLLTETAGLGPLPGSACLFAIRLVLVSVILQRRISMVFMHRGLCCHRLLFHHGGIFYFKKEMVDVILKLPFLFGLKSNRDVRECFACVEKVAKMIPKGQLYIEGDVSLK